MEINQIKYFCAVVETGHMRKAAQLLGISPGALSKSMRLLQDEIEQPLFIPSGRGLEITDEARQFYSQGRRVLSEFEMLSLRNRSEKIHQAQIRIASLELFTSHFMGVLIKNEFPSERVVVVERLPGKIEESILSRETDLGITYAPMPHPDLEFLDICTFEKGIYVKKGAFRGMPITEIPFSGSLIPVSGSPVGVTGLDGWPLDVPRIIRYQFELLETGLQAARLGICAIFCPDFVVRLQNQMQKAEFQLERLDLPKGMTPVKRTAYIVKRKIDVEGQTVKKLAKNLRKILLRGF
jgi:DNA-binding transcriptional LysR family regulator